MSELVCTCDGVVLVCLQAALEHRRVANSSARQFVLPARQSQDRCEASGDGALRHGSAGGCGYGCSIGGAGGCGPPASASICALTRSMCSNQPSTVVVSSTPRIPKTSTMAATTKAPSPAPADSAAAPAAMATTGTASVFAMHSSHLVTSIALACFIAANATAYLFA